MTCPERPYGGTSRQRLTDIINKSNDSSLIEGIDFEYGPVQELTPEELLVHAPHGHNTKIRLRAKLPGKADSDAIYTRLGIDILTHLPAEMLGEIIVDSLPLRIRVAIEKVNRALGLDLVPEEVEDTIFYDVRSEYPVTIREDASVAWLPSEVNVRARHAEKLALIWLNLYLSGFAPPPTDPALSLLSYTQLPASLLTELINRTNGTSVPVEALNFGVPSLTRQSPNQTAVSVVAKDDSGYNGSVEVIYDRIPLSFMGVNRPDLIIETHETSMHALIPFLNQVFGIYLTPDDIEDTPIPVQEPDVYTHITIRAKEGSLVYTGEFDLIFTLPLIELSSLITTWMLDGLYPPSQMTECTIN